MMGVKKNTDLETLLISRLDIMHGSLAMSPIRQWISVLWISMQKQLSLERILLRSRCRILISSNLLSEAVVAFSGMLAMDCALII
jgi:hypothetical protein